MIVVVRLTATLNERESVDGKSWVWLQQHPPEMWTIGGVMGKVIKVHSTGRVLVLDVEIPDAQAWAVYGQYADMRAELEAQIADMCTDKSTRRRIRKIQEVPSADTTV